MGMEVIGTHKAVLVQRVMEHHWNRMEVAVVAIEAVVVVVIQTLMEECHWDGMEVEIQSWEVYYFGD
jgi:hypothetical protein